MPFKSLCLHSDSSENTFQVWQGNIKLRFNCILKRCLFQLILWNVVLFLFLYNKIQRSYQRLYINCCDDILNCECQRCNCLFCPDELVKLKSICPLSLKMVTVLHNYFIESRNWKESNFFQLNQIKSERLSFGLVTIPGIFQSFGSLGVHAKILGVILDQHFKFDNNIKSAVECLLPTAKQSRKCPVWHSADKNCTSCHISSPLVHHSSFSKPRLPFMSS